MLRTQVGGGVRVTAGVGGDRFRFWFRFRIIYRGIGLGYYVNGLWVLG